MMLSWFDKLTMRNDGSCVIPPVLTLSPSKGEGFA